MPNDNFDKKYFSTEDYRPFFSNIYDIEQDDLKTNKNNLQNLVNTLVSFQKSNNWKVLVVDDDKNIHIVTSAVLEDYSFEGKDVIIFDAYNIEEAKKFLLENSDIALVFLDIVMEEEDAGLQIVKYIREDLKNNLIRIILRTGYEYNVPEKEMILNYDINGYQTKGELTTDRLFSVVTTSLRNYQLLMSILDYHINLEHKVKERTQDLKNSLRIIKKDLSIAKRIQKSILPKKMLKTKNIQFFARYIPKAEVGGDFYDIISLSEDFYRVIIADATGHGVQGALLTMAIKVEYDNVKKTSLSPAEILYQINNQFIEQFLTLNMFFTAAIFDINLKDQTIVYASAGHPEQFFVNNGSVIEIYKTGRMIGLLGNTEYKKKELSYSSTCRLYLFSDGLYEQCNEDFEEYGEGNVKKFFENNLSLPMEKCINNLIDEIQTFTSNFERQDDITLIGIEIHPYKEG
ncbi:MAG: fused response regulator/phosphatase [Leptospiraceae bacterium]|nr:fused response regulator/phosphatase [Leptospiraceae bacterium]MCP5496122.1 fused response regulator/phosphatase [Leptospiraceae bacterium]